MNVWLVEVNLNLKDTVSVRDRANLRLRVLLSYHYYRGIDIFKLFGKYFTKPWPDLFLDSGAFSAKTQGAVIDIGEYAEWVKHHESITTTYANIDVIGDATATMRNQRELERRGLQPLPVFHAHEPWSVLDGLCAQYPYVALGGIAIKRNRSAMRAWLSKCFAIADNRTVFHGFGVTSWGLMKDYPWYSVDGSSWGAGFRYGTVLLFDENLGKFIKINLRDKVTAWAQRKLLNSYGYRCSDLAIEREYDRAKICAMSAEAYMRAERWLRARNGEVVIPNRGGFRGDDKGFKVYITDANSQRIIAAQGKHERHY